MVGAQLVVFNMSQQTDSSDLLGGFRPVEPQDALRPLLDPFLSLMRRTWTKWAPAAWGAAAAFWLGCCRAAAGGAGLLLPGLLLEQCWGTASGGAGVVPGFLAAWPIALHGTHTFTTHPPARLPQPPSPSPTQGQQRGLPGPRVQAGRAQEVGAPGAGLQGGAGQGGAGAGGAGSCGGGRSSSSSSRSSSSRQGLARCGGEARQEAQGRRGRWGACLC